MNGTESDACCCLEEGCTEKELVTLLRKIGYEIPKDTQGSDKIYKHWPIE